MGKVHRGKTYAMVGLAYLLFHPQCWSHMKDDHVLLVLTDGCGRIKLPNLSNASFPSSLPGSRAFTAQFSKAEGFEFRDAACLPIVIKSCINWAGPNTRLEVFQPIHPPTDIINYYFLQSILCNFCLI